MLHLGLPADCVSQAVFVEAWFVYPFGAARKRPGFGRRIAFEGAMLVAGPALFGSFDDWAESSSALHMLQHMLLMVIVAPLLVVARPLPQWRALLGPASDLVWRPLLQLGRHPGTCALLHAAAICIWHAPGPYMAAVIHTGLHVLEHLSFLLTGWIFWWSVLQAGRSGAPAAAMALLFTATHTGMLGALLTFASTHLYWRESRELWDQQMAGLVMRVPVASSTSGRPPGPACVGWTTMRIRLSRAARARRGSRQARPGRRPLPRPAGHRRPCSKPVT